MIASRLGRPLCSDDFTSGTNRLDFARVCVEMNAGSDFPDCIEFLSELREIFGIWVVYRWKPQVSVASVVNLAKVSNDSLSSSLEANVESSIEDNILRNLSVAKDMDVNLKDEPENLRNLDVGCNDTDNLFSINLF